MKYHSIDAIELAELEPYRTLRERTWHWQEGHFVAESEKVVRALLRSDVQVQSLLLTGQWLHVLNEELSHPRFEETDVYVAPREVLESIVGYSLHQGVMAIGRIPDNLSHAALYRMAARSGLFVALEGIADAENMGMILRNCAGFGVNAVLVGENCCSPWLRRSVRVSVGHMFRIPVRRCENLASDLAALRDAGATVIAATPRAGEVTVLHGVAAATAGLSLCLLFGSEAHGLSDSVLAACDRMFSIPMCNDVDSLNVANTVAAALYAARFCGGHR
jgi:tRNA G18 (ribose-2'-O)-methylase SpoU